MSESEFLKLVTSQSDQESMQALISLRLRSVASDDYAHRLKSMPFWKIAIGRCPAIIATLALEMVVGTVIHNYRDTIRNQMLITSFMPVLSSISGNVGLQSSTATLRALSTGNASGSDIRGVLEVLIKEFLASVIIATAAALALFSIASTWAHVLIFGMTTGLSIFFSSCISGIMGALGPLLFRALKIDPALMAGPFETAMQDLLSTSIYLSLAYTILPTNSSPTSGSEP
eukprot:jgi/Hompol1/6521/HPOL_003539-RA